MRPTLTSAAELHAALLGSDSATEVLQRICHAPVTIRRIAAPAPRPTAFDPDAATHRRVELVGEGLVLSEADLWFLPALLPPALVRTLAETDLPFGIVMRPLRLRRESITARLCNPSEPCAVEHRALLRLPDGQAVAEVWERYSWALAGPV
jgi:hypothetical protein